MVKKVFKKPEAQNAKIN